MTLFSYLRLKSSLEVDWRTDLTRLKIVTWRVVVVDNEALGKRKIRVDGSSTFWQDVSNVRIVTKGFCLKVPLVV